jgi:hypothetical protein
MGQKDLPQMSRQNDIYGRKVVLDVVVRISESKKQEARSKRIDFRK